MRKRPRFRIKTYFPLTAHIRQSKSKFHQLVTVGEGGFGFYGSTKDAELVKMRRIDLTLVLGSKKYELPASVQYCTFIQQEKRLVNFFGVKFEDIDPKVEHLLKSLIESGLQKGHLIPA